MAAGLRNGLVLLLGLLALGGAAWLGRVGGPVAYSKLGYWLGVAGGLAMLALFAYPLRKRLAWMKNLGATRHWFIAHMLLGLLGPWLILVHCGLRIGSLNAAVALLSMLVVAASGVVGRFLYVRIHRGLSGERADLGELRAQLRSDHAGVGEQLASLPQVREALFAFEQRALAGASAAPWRMLALGWTAWRLLRQLKAEIARATADPVLRPRWQHQASAHLGQVLRVAQFAAWERLFALWHVLHIPFVYLMVVCAVVHVIAVHAY